MWADNTCDFCAEGLPPPARHGGRWGVLAVDGGQGEAVRVPQAQGTLVKLPVGEDSAGQCTMLREASLSTKGCALRCGLPVAVAACPDGPRTCTLRERRRPCGVVGQPNRPQSLRCTQTSISLIHSWCRLPSTVREKGRGGRADCDRA